MFLDLNVSKLHYTYNDKNQLDQRLGSCVLKIVGVDFLTPAYADNIYLRRKLLWNCLIMKCLMFSFLKYELHFKPQLIHKGKFVVQSKSNLPVIDIMMTSSNGNIPALLSPLWGESTGDRWIPLTKASDAEFWYFLWFAPEQTFSKRSRCRWFAMQSRSLWRHYNDSTVLAGERNSALLHLLRYGKYFTYVRYDTWWS